MNKKLFYFNGDSYTAGVGLGDFLFYTNYPGDMLTKYPNSEIVKKWHAVCYSNQNERYNENPEFYQKLNESNMNLSYPNQIGKLLDAEVINNAYGGSSIFGIFVRTVHDLQKLSNQNKIPDSVIIGLTAYERLTKILECFSSDSNTWTRGIMTNWVQDDPLISSSYKNYANTYWSSHSDEEMLIFFLYQCLSLKHYVKNLTGKYPIFLDTMMNKSHMTNIVKNTRNCMLTEVWNILNFDEIDNQLGILSFGEKYGYVADGHVNAKSHVEYAKYVVEYINNLEKIS